MKLVGFPKLQQTNFRAAMLHYAVMLAFFIWFWVSLKPTFQNVNVYRLQATAPPADQPQKNTLNFNVKAKSLYYQSIPFWLMTFFALTSFAHITYATDFFGTGLYALVISQGWNPFRWLEYGITASIMIYILCLLNGVRDVAATWPIVISMAVVMGQGFVIENQLRKASPDWTTVTAATVFGWILLTTAFIVLGYTLTTLIIDALQYDSKVPIWVPLLTIVQFINFALFGFNQLKHISLIKKGGSFDYAKIESAYIKLSFTAKVFLAGFLCYGLLQWQSRANRLE